MKYKNHLIIPLRINKKCYNIYKNFYNNTQIFFSEILKSYVKQFKFKSIIKFENYNYIDTITNTTTYINNILFQNNFLIKTLKLILIKQDLYVYKIPNNNIITNIHKNLNLPLSFFKYNTSILSPLNVELNIQLNKIIKHKTINKNITNNIVPNFLKYIIGINSIEFILELYESQYSYIINTTLGILINSYNTIQVNNLIKITILLEDIIIPNNIIIYSKQIQEDIELTCSVSKLMLGGCNLSIGNISTQNCMLSYFNTTTHLTTLFNSVYYSISFAYNLLFESILKQYNFQGIILPSVMFELIVKKLVSYVKIKYSGDTCFIQEDIVSFTILQLINISFSRCGMLGAFYEPIILGITKVNLSNNGILATISFQETIKLLSKFILDIQFDWLLDLKSKIITTELLESGTGWYKKFIL